MEISGSNYLSNIATSTANIHRSSERIASGVRINSAADDAAGLAISNRQTTDIRGFTQSIRNASDGVSRLQASSASLESVTSGVQRLRELALQAANGTLTDSDRSALNSEASLLQEEVVGTIENTQFNGRPLLSGDTQTRLQVGPGSDDGVVLESGHLTDVLAKSGFGDIDISTADGARYALSALDDVQAGVDEANASVGSGLNRLDSTINNLYTSSQAAQESRSRIQDADVARELTDQITAQTQRDAATLVQAIENRDRGSVLSLLGS